MCSSFDFVPAPNSLDLSSLVQTQLLKAEQQLPNHRLETLDDLRSMVGKLSEITNICVDYIDNAKEKPTRRAFQEMEYGFEWNNCKPWPLQRSAQDDIIYSLRYALVLQAVEIGPSPPAPTFLFRAARNTSHRTSYVPPAARRWSFNNFHRCRPVDDFFDALARHLGKVREVNQTSGKAVDKHLTSMSPILEWALHRTGQKWRDCTDDDQVKLVIYDLQALRNVSDGGVFRVSDVLRFLEKQNKMYRIDAELQQWAENCDEYITIGTGLDERFVRSIPWGDLCKMPIISATFCRAYTLGIYRQWRDEKIGFLENVEKDEVYSRVLQLAKAVAGAGQENDGRVREILRLILMPGIWFWEIATDLTEDEVLKGCERLLEDDLIQSLSQVSISK